MTHGFVRWTLRTSDVAAARDFYDALLLDGAPDVIELPEALRARGAKPHWLGHLATPHVEQALEAFVARGAQRLGSAGLLRDPSGAVLALTAPQDKSRSDIAWQQLLTPTPARAKQDYADLFGLRPGARVEDPSYGVLDPFGWDSDEAGGAIGDISNQPHIHPQWLFFFRVSNLERAMSQIQERGGKITTHGALPGRRILAVGEDPQGAQLALMQIAD